MTRKCLLTLVAVLVPLAAASVLSGCGGSGGEAAFFTV